MYVPLSRTLIINETTVVRNLKDRLSYPGTDIPTPVPAPVFVVAPSITPNGGLVGQTFAANAYSASNAVQFDRRWLFRASGTTVDTVAGTGPSVFMNAPGTLKLEVTAIGPGGLKTVATSSAVFILADTPAVYRMPLGAYAALLV